MQKGSAQSQEPRTDILHEWVPRSSLGYEYLTVKGPEGGRL